MIAKVNGTDMGLHCTPEKCEHHRITHNLAKHFCNRFDEKRGENITNILREDTSDGHKFFRLDPCLENDL